MNRNDLKGNLDLKMKNIKGAVLRKNQYFQHIKKFDPIITLWHCE